MKRFKLLFFCLGLCLLTGCSRNMNRREIDEINFIHVMGIDYTDDKYIITAVYSMGGNTEDSESGNSGGEEISTGKGTTAFEAFEDLRLKNKKTVSIANTGYFLIGDSAARHGIDNCLDFLSRDETVKMESLIFVTKGTDAASFLSRSMENGQVIHEDLEAIEQKQMELVTRNDNTLVNILNDMENNMTGIIIPYLISGNNSFLIEGYAVFDRNVLADYLDKETSSGVNFIKNIIRTYPIYLKNNVSLSVTDSKCKIKSKIKNKGIRIVIKLDFETAVKEVNTDKDIFTTEKLESLTALQNDYILGILKKAVNYSAENKRDILQIERLIQNRHAGVWKNYKENWKDYLDKIQYEFQINSEITKSFVLSN